MHNAIVSKRYTVNLLAVLLLSTVAFKAAAAPICAQVLKALPTEAEVSATLDDLAEMAVQTDIEKAEGNSHSILSKSFKTKSSEVMKILNLNKAQLSELLRSRIVKIQEQRESSSAEKKRRKEQEAKDLHFDPPQWVKNPKKRIPGHMPLLLDIATFPDGIQRALRITMTTEGRELSIYNPLETEPSQVIAKTSTAAAIDKQNQRLVVAKKNAQGEIEFNFLSMTDFKEVSQPLPINFTLEQASSIAKASLKISDDGSGFSFYSDTGLYLRGEFKDIKSLTPEKGKSFPFMINAHEHLYIQQGTYSDPLMLKMERDGQLVGQVVLPNYPKIQMLDTNHIVAIMAGQIFVINIQSFKIVSEYKNPFKDAVVLHGFVIGTDGRQVSMRSLEQLNSSETIFDFSDVAEFNTRFTGVHLFENGKTLVLEGTENDTGNRYFYILDRKEDKP